tara:strand:+ start:711 stop:917 length:207 start_codon:yes stop_codon:yes gene_type:complete
MKEVIIQQLKLKLDKDKDYSKLEIKKVINNILQQNEIELSLYIKIASREKRDIDTIIKEFYKKENIIK